MRALAIVIDVQQTATGVTLILQTTRGDAARSPIKGALAIDVPAGHLLASARFGAELEISVEPASGTPLALQSAAMHL